MLKEKIKARKKHHRAKVGFNLVEKARDMYEFEETKIKDIQAYLSEYGYDVPYWTLVDWLFYITRING